MSKILLLIFSVVSQILSAQGLIGTPNRLIFVESHPKGFYKIQVNGIVSQIVSSKESIGTPNSIILVCNYPNNYFYIRVKGKDIYYTEKDGVYIIDNKLIQIMAARKSKFLEDTNEILSSKEFIEKYIKWEIGSIESNFSHNANSKIEFLRSASGKEVALWSYDLPILDPESKMNSDTTFTLQKQMFVLTKLKDFVVGIYSPLFLESQYNLNKTYLLENIDGLEECDKFIDIEELNKLVNN
jgi:hypothetical protein